jgi:hypothetical protein
MRWLGSRRPAGVSPRRLGDHGLDLDILINERLPVGEGGGRGKHTNAVGAVVVPPTGGHVILDRRIRLDAAARVWMQIQLTGEQVDELPIVKPPPLICVPGVFLPPPQRPRE